MKAWQKAIDRTGSSRYPMEKAQWQLSVCDSMLRSAQEAENQDWETQVRVWLQEAMRARLGQADEDAAMGEEAVGARSEQAREDVVVEEQTIA